MSRASPREADALLSAAQVAARCAVSVRTVRRWIEAGLLPALRLGRMVRVREADLAAMLARSRL